jgi:hypothetical protein
MRAWRTCTMIMMAWRKLCDEIMWEDALNLTEIKKISRGTNSQSDNNESNLVQTPGCFAPQLQLEHGRK